jgi:hypothetical protein
MTHGQKLWWIRSDGVCGMLGAFLARLKCGGFR